MKSLKLRLLLLCTATVFTLCSAHVVAKACADIDSGSNVYGSWDCRLTQECEGWCYYSCTCSNLFAGYTCNDVLREAHFELVQGTGGCY